MPKGSDHTHVGLQLYTNEKLGNIARKIYMERVVHEYMKYTNQVDYFTVKMPCGSEYVFNEKNVPSEIMLCRCKDPKHIVVLWRFVDGGQEGD